MTPGLDTLAVLHRQLLVVRRHCQVLACSPMPTAVAAVFARLAAAKGELAGQLARELEVQTPSAVASGRGITRLYRRWFATASGSLPAANSADVVALVAAEDRLLHHCEQWLARSSSPALRAALKRYLPQVQACHAELRRLHPATSLQAACRSASHAEHRQPRRRWQSAASESPATSSNKQQPTQEMEKHMNEDILKGKFKQLTGRVKAKWGELTDDDLALLEGKRDVLIGKLQEKYGLSKEKALEQIKELEDAL